MHADKRYSVFISSTFEDLKEERRAIQNVITSGGDFPVQMEDFPATDEPQLEFIKSLIDKCDYYVLVIAGRYGTPTEDGTSFTEKEYKYAVQKGIPVIAMLHENPGRIERDKSEESGPGRKNLERFVAEVEKNRIRKHWNSIGELQLQVRIALDHAKSTKPAIGWVRGDTTASIDVLNQLNVVRQENDKFREKIGSLQIELDLPPIPEAKSEVLLDLYPLEVTGGYGPGHSGTYAKLKTSWLDAFPIFYSNLSWQTSDWNGEISYYVEVDQSLAKIGSAFAAELAEFNTSGLFQLSKNSFERLQSYYIEVGLMDFEAEYPFTETGRSFARRHQIIDTSATRVTLVKGSIEQIELNSSQRNLDDEIPF